MKVTEKELVKALEKEFPDHIIFANNIIMILMR